MLWFQVAREPNKARQDSRQQETGHKERDERDAHGRSVLVCKECEMLSGGWYVSLMQAIKNRRSTKYRHLRCF